MTDKQTHRPTKTDIVTEPLIDIPKKEVKSEGTKVCWTKDIFDHAYLKSVMGTY